MKKLWWFVISIFLLSCTNTLEKSVLTPLTESELNEAIQKDTCFKETHQLIANARKFIVLHDFDTPEQYKELTYGKVNKHYTLYKNPSFMSHITSEYHRGHSKKMEYALKQNELLALRFLKSVSR